MSYEIEENELISKGYKDGFCKSCGAHTLVRPEYIEYESSALVTRTGKRDNYLGDCPELCIECCHYVYYGWRTDNTNSKKINDQKTESSQNTEK